MISLVWALVLSAASIPHAGPSCNILHARYDLAGAPEYHLQFVKLASSKEVISDIGIHIYSTDPKAELWYYLDEGSIPRVSLISTTDPTKPGWHAEPDGGIRPHGSATFIGMNEDGTIAPDAVNSSSSPPRYVIIPELAQVYKGLRINYWPGAFVLKSCRR